MDVLVLLKIHFFGLIAFVPNHQTNPTVISALLVDATNPPQSSDGCDSHEHTPSLLVARTGDCYGACKKLGDFCECPLERVEAILEEANLVGCQKEKSDKRVACQSPDFSYVPRMNKIRSRAKKANHTCLGKSYSSDAPALLASRILNINVNSPIQAVKFVGETFIPDNKFESTPQSFEFRSLSDSTWFPHRIQDGKLAEVLLIPTVVRGTLEKDTGLVKITLKSLDSPHGTSEVKIEATRCSEGGVEYCASIFIANRMTNADDSAGRCHDRNIGRHFELFYDLAENEIWPRGKPVPHRTVESGNKSEVTRDFDPLVINFLKLLRGGENRPICPMVTLSQ